MRYNRYSLRLKLSLVAREPLESQQSLPTCQDTTPTPPKNARQRPTTSATTATRWATLVETAGCLTSDYWRKGQVLEIQERNVLDQDNRLDAHSLPQTTTKKSPTPNLSNQEQHLTIKANSKTRSGAKPDRLQTARTTMIKSRNTWCLDSQSHKRSKPICWRNQGQNVGFHNCWRTSGSIGRGWNC